jgi:lysophospholipase L1-like esterase
LRLLLLSLVFGVGLVVALEVGLRVLFGFGNPLTYISDEEIGYLLAPNQRTRRFGNRIMINDYSMRSSTIDVTRSPACLRVLLLGDSVANGAWWTDQDKTLSALMTRRLKVDLPSYHEVEVLNASANSWGPRNELAYLRRFGTFDAQVVVLLINTDDLFSTAPTSIPVGRDRNYPSKKPPSALAEVFERYFTKAPPIPEMKAVNSEEGDRVGFNLEAIRQIQQQASNDGAQFLLGMTPLLRELGQPGSRDYEQRARSRLLELTQKEQIPYLDFLPSFNDTPAPASLYRDHIHLSPEGYQRINGAIARSLQKLLQQSEESFNEGDSRIGTGD